MALATLFWQCPKCDELSRTPGQCSVCNCELETKALVDDAEVRKLVKQLTTPEGIVAILNKLNEFLQT